MKHRRLIGCLVFVALQSAANAESVFTLTIKNESSHALIFERKGVARPGIELALDKNTMLPGESATVTGTTTTDSDLSGVIHFENNIQLRILNPRQFHTVQPQFAMRGEHVVSRVDSMTRNTEIAPRLLLYASAELTVKDKN